MDQSKQIYRIYMFILITITFSTTICSAAFLFRAPFLDRATVHTENIGGNFAYATSELLAYTPFYYHSPLPFLHLPYFIIPSLKPGGLFIPPNVQGIGGINNEIEETEPQGARPGHSPPLPDEVEFLPSTPPPFHIQHDHPEEDDSVVIDAVSK